MRGFLYILFFVLVSLCFGLLNKLTPSHELTDGASEAELLISNSRLYAKEHAYSRSLHQLDLAIETIVEIEQNLDKESRENIDKAVSELRKVYTEIEDHKLVNTDMNNAFTKTMNALTYAELKITEHFIETEDFHAARAALKAGMIHMENALKFADKGHKSYELQIYTEIDSLLQHSLLSKVEIVAELEKMLEELNTLVED